MKILSLLILASTLHANIAPTSVSKSAIPSFLTPIADTNKTNKYEIIYERAREEEYNKNYGLASTDLNYLTTTAGDNFDKIGSVYVMLGMVYGDQFGLTEISKVCFTKALKFNLNNYGYSFCYEHLSQFYDDGSEQQLSYLKKAFSYTPKDCLVNFDLMNFYWEKAKNEILSQDYDDSNLNLKLAKIYKNNLEKNKCGE